jgi:nicotinamidase-related amidase
MKPALLIIDVQKRYMESIPGTHREIGIFFINLLIGLFRKKDLPIFRIYHTNSENGPRPGTEEFEYHPSINIRPEDIQLIKTYSDSFNKTDLERILSEKGIDTIFISGLSAVGCVLATFVGAMNNDLKPFMVKNAIMSHDPEYTKNIEVMFDAVSYDVVKLIVENS